MRISRFAGWMMLLSFSSIPATPSWADTYTPTEAEAMKRTVEQATNSIVRFYAVCLDDPPVYKAEILPDLIKVVFPSTPKPWVSLISLRDVKVTVTFDQEFLSTRGKLKLDYEGHSWINGKMYKGSITRCENMPNDWPKIIGDSILRLKLEYDKFNSADGMEKFKEVALQYQQANPKPDITEDVRRLKIQAEDALNAKRLTDSLEKYQKIIDIAPWWPDAHFNRALMLAELQCFDSSMNEMKRYLMLVPDSPLARSAQDKIYSWEAYPYSGK